MTQIPAPDLFAALLLLHGPPGPDELAVRWTEYKLNVAQSMREMGVIKNLDVNMVNLFIIWCIKPWTETPSFTPPC